MADAHVYLRRLADDALERSSEIATALSREGTWSDSVEWRISTVTEERIENRTDRLVVWSKCDAEFTAIVAGLEQALQARSVFWRLHANLFQAVGWPSWAGYRRSAPDDPPHGSHAEDAAPYLAELATAFVGVQDGRGAEIEAAIEASSRWEKNQSGVREAVVVREFYPALPPEATEPAFPELRFEVRVERGGVSACCFCPTPERAVQFLGIFQGLTADLVAVFGFHASRVG